MQSAQERNLDMLPVGDLGIIALQSSKTIGAKIDRHIVTWRKEREHQHQMADSPSFQDYARDSSPRSAERPGALP